MRFFITLSNITPDKQAIIPINYQYPLSACLYKIIAQSDPEYAFFLHDTGYGRDIGKAFKFFTFSNINVPFRIKNDRLICLQSEITFTVCFHLPYSAETFIKGLFLHRKIDIADKKSKSSFIVTSVQTLPDPFSQMDPDSEIQVKLYPVSPIVCISHNDRGYYDYLSPEAKDEFRSSLLYNWREKIKVLDHQSEVKEPMDIDIILRRKPPKAKLITIKEGTPQETKIRGFMNFDLNVTAPVRYIQLLLNCGAGVGNSQGFGCLNYTQ